MRKGENVSLKTKALGLVNSPIVAEFETNSSHHKDCHKPRRRIFHKVEAGTEPSWKDHISCHHISYWVEKIARGLGGEMTLLTKQLICTCHVVKDMRFLPYMVKGRLNGWVFGTANPCTSNGFTKARYVLHGLLGRFWFIARRCTYAGKYKWSLMHQGNWSRMKSIIRRMICNLL